MHFCCGSCQPSIPLWSAPATSEAPAAPDGTPVILLADRSWALSGDTVWFVVSGDPASLINGHVVHVQLENYLNIPVDGVMVVTDHGKGEGYLPVPDSLATGLYWMRAYTRTLQDDTISAISRTLAVIHRFEESYSGMKIPGDFLPLATPGFPGLDIRVSSGDVKPRSLINVKLDIPEDVWPEIRELVVSASLVDSSLQLPGTFYSTPLVAGYNGTPDNLPAELNGFFIEGRVIPEPGHSLPRQSLVLLSIPDSLPWFDYYLAGRDGYFRFQLKNAFGTAQIYLRAIAGEGEKLGIELSETRVTGARLDTATWNSFGISGKTFVREMTEAGWYERLFATERKVRRPEFRMPPRSAYPFYGKPEHRVFPSDFIELPDFMEISRELLPAVKFRGKDGIYSIRIVDELEHDYFDRSPLRLVNGIPVFDNNLISRFGSEDIRYIDILYRERIFGDLSFKGVLALTLNRPVEDWVNQERNLYGFSVPCLQIPLEPSSHQHLLLKENSPVPDLRRVFLFERIHNPRESAYSFRVSDLKGTVKVEIQGVTTRNQPFVITKEIEVR